jgi:hypothetical protein
MTKLSLLCNCRRAVECNLHRPSRAAPLAVFACVLLAQTQPVHAAIMEVDAVGTIDYYHYDTLVRSVVIPTVSYFDTLGPEVPNPLFGPPYLAGNQMYYQSDGSFYAMTFAVAGFAVNDASYDWPGLATPNWITYQGATPSFLSFNDISQSEFSSLQDPWATIFNGATFSARSTEWPVSYAGVSATYGDPGLLPNGISISLTGSIHEVPEPPVLMLLGSGLIALLGMHRRSTRYVRRAG